MSSRAESTGAKIVKGPALGSARSSARPVCVYRRCVVCEYVYVCVFFGRSVDVGVGSAAMVRESVDDYVSANPAARRNTAEHLGQLKMDDRFS